jgi:hypothetical protein
MRPSTRVGCVRVALCVLLAIAGCTAQDGAGQLDGGGRLLAEAVVSAATGGTVTMAMPDVLAGTTIAIAASPSCRSVTVPTPIDQARRPHTAGDGSRPLARTAIVL